jgi:hypothetical protein
MTTNLHQAMNYESDRPSGDLNDVSLLADRTITTSDGVLRLPCDVVLIDRTRTSKRSVQLKRLVSIDDDNNDDEDFDDTGSRSSTSSNFVCARTPPSPNSTMSRDDDPSGDVLGHDIFFHPLSQCIESENMPLTAQSTASVESSKKLILESTAQVSGSSNIGSYSMLRITYLLVTLVIMLADGLQGKLYEM